MNRTRFSDLLERFRGQRRYSLQDIALRLSIAKGYPFAAVYADLCELMNDEPPTAREDVAR